MFKKLSILIIPALVMVSGAYAQAQEKGNGAAVSETKYNCPYLHDASRRTISELTQGKDGWFFRVGGIKEYFALLPHASNYLQRLNKAFESQNTKLIMMQVPPRTFASSNFLDRSAHGQETFNIDDGISYYKAKLDAIKGAGPVVVDGLDQMYQKEKSTGLHFFFKRDTHWTPFGAKLMAKNVKNALNKDPKYKTLKSDEYTTEITGHLKLKGTIAMEIEKLCTDSVVAEPYPSYQTNIQLDKGKNALFGESNASAPLVLLGSSFSAIPWFNFDGFLSEETGLEVANFAISGGQLFNSLISYTSLPKDQRLSPDFIIWENLAHYDINNGDAMFRQAIPAVYGECSAEEAIKTANLRISENDKSVAIFDNLSDFKVTGADYYLFLKANNVGFANFTLEMEYEDGDGEWLTIDRRNNFNNSGRFFVELSDEIDSLLNQVNLVGFANTAADIEVRLCHI